VIPAYRGVPSPLASARAGATATLCLALALVCMLYASPAVLVTVVVAVVVAGALAGVATEIRRAMRLALPLVVLVALINPLVYRDGDTLLVRGGELLGRRFDVTLEAVVAGGLAGLRIAALILAFGLFSACVDPDELLKLFRRVSYRSALTAALATRLVPVLARDALRMNDAARCRPVQPGRLAVVRAALAGALDRAVEVAAALEVRGYSTGGRPRRAGSRWSRHDVRVAAAAGSIALVAIAFRGAGAGGVETYPRIEIALGPPEVVLCALLLAAVALPFAGRSARLGVARA
jgi:energy-coupling factor transport system permease protein